MPKLKLLCLIACFILCLMVFVGLAGQQVAAAKSEGATSLPLVSPQQASPPEEKIELSTKYPVLSGTAETAFAFDVEIRYRGGEEKKDFNLSAEAPPDWLVEITTGSYGTAKQIASVLLDPLQTYAETITVTAVALPWKLPEPGEYSVRFKVAESTTGEPQNSIDLKAKVTARYSFIALTEDGRLNMKATAGKESYLPITITNTGTATLDKITFSSDRPEKWSVTFKPEKIESLSPWDEQEVEVTVKPPSDTISGDYMVTLKFSGEPTSHSDDLAIRVAVGTSTRWGLIGVGIVIAVIAGLVVGFRQLGRR